MYLNQNFVINSFEFFFSTLFPSHVQHLLKKEEYKHKIIKKNLGTRRKEENMQKHQLKTEKARMRFGDVPWLLCIVGNGSRRDMISTSTHFRAMKTTAMMTMMLTTMWRASDQALAIAEDTLKRNWS